jgi:hypothetical protein
VNGENSCDFGETYSSGTVTTGRCRTPAALLCPGHSLHVMYVLTCSAYSVDNSV